MPDEKESQDPDAKQVSNTRATLEEKLEKWGKKILAVSGKGNQEDMKKYLRSTEE